MADQDEYSSCDEDWKSARSDFSRASSFSSAAGDTGMPVLVVPQQSQGTGQPAINDKSLGQPVANAKSLVDEDATAKIGQQFNTQKPGETAGPAAPGSPSLQDDLTQMSVLTLDEFVKGCDSKITPISGISSGILEAVAYNTATAEAVQKLQQPSVITKQPSRLSKAEDKDSAESRGCWGCLCGTPAS